MKKILVILLLISNFSFGQITIDKTFFGLSSASTNATSLPVLNKTYTAGKMYLFCAMTTGTTNPGTITATTTTWQNVINAGDATVRIQIFKLVPTATASSEDVTLGSFGGGSSGFAYYIWEVTGSTIIRQSTTASATSTDPTINLNQLITNGESAVMAFFANGRNIFDGTVEAGWTEDNDNGYLLPETGYLVASRISTTDNSVVITSASSSWVGVALEMITKRRVTLID